MIQAKVFHNKDWEEIKREMNLSEEEMVKLQSLLKDATISIEWVDDKNEQTQAEEASG